MGGGQIGFIGAGNMAAAIIGGVRRSGLYQPGGIMVYDVNQQRMAEMAAQGYVCASSAAALAQDCPMVFFAVKPQNFEEVLLQIPPAVGEDTLFVTIAAGISTNYIRQRVNPSCRVVRAMPNTPLLLGAGATALCRTQNVPDEAFDQVKRIFQASGVVEIMEESQMNQVVSVNGSSPAYVYLFAKALVDGAKAYGIDGAAALRLVAQTLAGSAKMLLESGKTPEELIQMVSSPGGTTLAALDVLEQADFTGILRRAMEQCTRRAMELGR